MSVVYKRIDKETFVPEKNYFKCEEVQVSRAETPLEIELWNNMVNWDNRGMAAIGLGILFCIILGIASSCIATATEQSLWLIGCGVGFGLFVGGLVFANVVCWPKEREWADIRREWYREHEEELWASATVDVRAYNEEQQRIAEAWRAEHPLEEMIRACIRDPRSSVDVANLARYYAEIYIKEKENEQ